MIRTIVRGAVLVALTASAAHTATPFGGDDAGFIPPDAPKGPIAKCENGVAKAGGKLVAAILKCHASRVSGKFADDAAEDACEQTARAKFAATKTTGCAPCTGVLTGGTIEPLVDGANSAVYCTATGTPFGGDDAGNIPPDAPKGPLTKCANGVAKATGKLVGTILKCHIGRVSGKLADDTAEETCETTAKMTFTTKTKTTGCDSCVNLTTLAGLAEVGADSSGAYCASPSGAFLDAGR
jgi:hypothetical protein